MNATESKDQPSWKQMLALATFIAGVLREIYILYAKQIILMLKND
jgi:hypothetical protein